MTRVGDVIERGFHDYAAALESDYSVNFGYNAAYVVVLYKGKLVEEHYTGEGHWWAKRRALRSIVRGHKKFLAVATAEGVALR